MKEYKGEEIRNVGIAGHNGSGKTSLAEAMLFNMHETTRIGHVEQGNTISDYLQDEIERQISLGSSLLHGDWNNNKINFIDTPGFSDFFGEVVSSLWAVDNVMISVSSQSSIEIGTESAWDLAEKYQKTRFFVINKLDKDNVDFDQVYDDIHESFGHRVVLMQFPVQTGAKFTSIVDVLSKKLYTFANDSSGKVTIGEVPADLKDKAEDLHTKFVESIAESNDELLEKYLETGELSDEEIIVSFKKALLDRTIAPVFCASGKTNVGVSNILDFIIKFLPNPLEVTNFKLDDGKVLKCTENAPFIASVFKTFAEAHVGELSYIRIISGVLRHGSEVLNASNNVSERIGQLSVLNGKNKQSVSNLYTGDIGALVKLKSTHSNQTLCSKDLNAKLPLLEFPEPVISIAVSPKKQGDENKIGSGLHTLHEEDPTFVMLYDPELKQTIISGLGELHLDIIIQRLKQRFGVEVETALPKVPYRETIKAKAEAEGKHKKQTGGHGQFGHALLRVEPLPRGGGFEFVDAIVGGVIPGKFIPAVQKGIEDIMKEGILAGFPVVDVKATCFHGSYHTVDSSELAFRLAGSIAFKKAFDACKPVLLEPIYDIEVRVPEQFMGDVMGNISGRRGKIMGMEAEGKFQVVKAKVPLAELHRYSTDLRSMTQGKGIFKRQFSHYEEVAPEFATKIIEAAAKEKEKE